MLIKHLKVSGLLSFGPKGIDLPMRNLNVLIGPNGSGKSNLLEVINLLHEAPSPRSIAGPITDGGGVDEWMWKGDWKLDDAPPPAYMSCVIRGFQKDEDIRHKIAFFESRHFVRIADESIELNSPPEGRESLSWFYRMNRSSWEVGAKHFEAAMRTADGVRRISHDSLKPSASILAQVRDPGAYPAFEHLERHYSRIELYRDWSFGPRAALRLPPKVDGRMDNLSPSGENLALVVNAMSGVSQARIVKALRTLYPDISGVRTAVAGGGNLQLFLEEKGGIEIPASRLSDGTLRYLSLLVILLNPTPPPLIVIEEPELGLHPDVIYQVAKLLIEASERTQLVITTHSRQLVDCLGDDPESVIVCEKHDGESVFERLDGERMKVWMEKFSLGELWSKGEIGGNRW